LFLHLGDFDYDDVNDLGRRINAIGKVLGSSAQAEQYDFVIWISSKPWIEEVDVQSDSWARSALERQGLSDYISETVGRGPQNLLAISSDAHMLAFDDGTNTYYGKSNEATPSFPILQSGPLDRMGDAKGGPFTEGCFATDLQRNHQYSTLSFEFPDPSDEQHESTEEACLTIRAYSVERHKDEIFSKTLCGAIFQPSEKDVRRGTCDISRFSKQVNFYFFFACGWLALSTGMIQQPYGACHGVVGILILWIGSLVALWVDRLYPWSKALSTWTRCLSRLLYFCNR